MRITKADRIKCKVTQVVAGAVLTSTLERAISNKVHNEENRTRTYRRYEQEKDAEWIPVQAEHRRDSPAVDQFDVESRCPFLLL